jgi:hypothetical protein
MKPEAMLRLELCYPVSSALSPEDQTWAEALIRQVMG